MNRHCRTLVAAFLLSSGACTLAQPIPVEVVQDDDGWKLLRDGKPYFVRGAGGDTDIELLASLGANSIRTWGQDQLEPRSWQDGRVMSVLDRAHELGLTVTVGFWVQHPRHGFDYDNEAAVENQLKEARAFARKFKDHPAVLMWGVGNEVLLEYDAARALREVERVAKVFKEEDPDHPTMTAVPGIWPEHARLFDSLCPSVDILGVNIYGGLPAVPAELTRQGYDGPYIPTEFGPLGPWEMEKTAWGAPLEQTSSEKASSFRTTYEAGVLSLPDRCLGSYAFFWGAKQECTATWFGMLLKTGERLASSDTMSYLWTGGYPENRAPDVTSFDVSIARREVAAGTAAQASVTAIANDDDTLSYKWVIKSESADRRSGGDAEAEPKTHDSLIDDPASCSTSFRAPQEPGAYRLFVYVFDSHGCAATANVPFAVGN